MPILYVIIFIPQKSVKNRFLLGIYGKEYSTKVLFPDFAASFIYRKQDKNV